ncbi:hypothetical protein Peetri_00080 [Pseudomonas phage vB_PpuM-Peetri]
MTSPTEQVIPTVASVEDIVTTGVYRVDDLMVMQMNFTPEFTSSVKFTREIVNPETKKIVSQQVGFEDGSIFSRTHGEDGDWTYGPWVKEVSDVS